MSKTKPKTVGQPAKGKEPIVTNIIFYKKDRVSIKKLLKTYELKHVSELMRVLIAEAVVKI